jgi:hypothetical protein
MKKHTPHAFVNQLLVCLLVSICFGGSVGLGTVWMRHQVSIAADMNRALKNRISKLEEKISALSVEILQEQTPDVLRRRNESMRIGLVEVKDPQIVRVVEDPVALLVARRNRERAEESFVVGIHLADLAR